MTKCTCGIEYPEHIYHLQCFCGNIITQEIVYKHSVLYSPWTSLHEYPNKHAENWKPVDVINWYWSEFVPMIPCGFCTQHWFGWVEKNPLEEAVQSPSLFFIWGWNGHNWVSENHSHKPTLTLKEALDLWWPNSVNIIPKTDVK